MESASFKLQTCSIDQETEVRGTHWQSCQLTTNSKVGPGLLVSIKWQNSVLSLAVAYIGTVHIIYEQGSNFMNFHHKDLKDCCFWRTVRTHLLYGA